MKNNHNFINKINNFSKQEKFDEIYKIINNPKNNNYRACWNWLKNNIDIIRDDDENTLLLKASKNNSKIIDKLLKYGANPFYTNRWGYDSLSIASQHEQLSVIKKLIIFEKKLIDHDHQHPPFYLAIERKNKTIIELLLSMEPSLYLVDENGENGLHKIAKFILPNSKLFTKFLKLIEKQKNKIEWNKKNVYEKNAWVEAIINKNYDFSYFLINKQINTDIAILIKEKNINTNILNKIESHFIVRNITQLKEGIEVAIANKEYELAKIIKKIVERLKIEEQLPAGSKEQIRKL